MIYVNNRKHRSYLQDCWAAAVYSELLISVVSPKFRENWKIAQNFQKKSGIKSLIVPYQSQSKAVRRLQTISKLINQSVNPYL
jgi:hypothetical protein